VRATEARLERHGKSSDRMTSTISWGQAKRVIVEGDLSILLVGREEKKTSFKR
jgi:hypothetical protein